MTIEDVIKKSILPLAFMVFWFWMTKTIMRSVDRRIGSGGYLLPDFHLEYIKCG